MAAGVFCRVRLKTVTYQARTNQAITSTAQPPMTPPAIAPTFTAGFGSGSGFGQAIDAMAIPHEPPSHSAQLFVIVLEVPGQV